MHHARPPLAHLFLLHGISHRPITLCSGITTPAARLIGCPRPATTTTVSAHDPPHGPLRHGSRCILFPRPRRHRHVHASAASMRPSHLISTRRPCFRLFTATLAPRRFCLSLSLSWPLPLSTTLGPGYSILSISPPFAPALRTITATLARRRFYLSLLALASRHHDNPRARLFYLSISPPFDPHRTIFAPAFRTALASLDITATLAPRPFYLGPRLSRHHGCFKRHHVSASFARLHHPLPPIVHLSYLSSTYLSIVRPLSLSLYLSLYRAPLSLSLLSFFRSRLSLSLHQWVIKARILLYRPRTLHSPVCLPFLFIVCYIRAPSFRIPCPLPCPLPFGIVVS